MITFSRFDLRTLLVNLDSRIQCIIIGIIVGTASGLAALGLKFSLEYLTLQTQRIPLKWTLLFLPSLGILLTVVLLKHVIRDFGGHGIQEVIFAIGMRGGKMRLSPLRIGFIDILAAAGLEVFAALFAAGLIRTLKTAASVLKKNLKNDLAKALFGGILVGGIVYFFQEVRRDSRVEILRKFDLSQSWSLPVIEHGHFLGLISKATLLDHYRKELLAQTEI